MLTLYNNLGNLHRDFDSKFVNISHKITEDFLPKCRVTPHLSNTFTLDQLRILSGET
jgi:hypothetical protein